MKKQNPIIGRLFTAGPSALNTEELLTLLLDEQAAYHVMQKTRGSLKILSSMYLTELKALPTITPRKAAIIAAFCELNRRRNDEVVLKKTIVSSADVASYLQDKIGDNQHEAFVVLYLNRSNRINACEIVSIGGITGTVADLRLLIKKALDYRAVSLILAHNHPSGQCKPSRQDEELTIKIKEAAKFFDIKVLDHVIVSQDGYYSFADEGVIL